MYTMQVLSGNEEKTKELCLQIVGRQLLESCFIPRYESAIKYGGEWHKKQEVLFPGYLFFESKQIDAVFLALKGVPKLTKILGTGEDIIQLSKQEEDMLRQLVNEEYLMEMSSGYAVGKQVHIINGPLRNLQGYIRKVDRHKRLAIVEMVMFGRVMNIKMGFEVFQKYSETVST